jgi:hypothetical protein
MDPAPGWENGMPRTPDKPGSPKAPWPKALTYALAINLAFGMVILAATAIAYGMQMVLARTPSADNAYHVFLGIGLIYSAVTFLAFLLFGAYGDALFEGLARLCGNKPADDFFSMGFILFTIGWTALATIGFGALLFLFVMFGLTRYLLQAIG